MAGTEQTGTTFRDAAAEYLRFVEDVRQIDTKTASDYLGVVEGYLLEEFGELAIEAVTPRAHPCPEPPRRCGTSCRRPP